MVKYFNLWSSFDKKSENYNKCININYYKGNDSSKVTSGAGGSDSILFYEK